MARVDARMSAGTRRAEATRPAPPSRTPTRRRRSAEPPFDVVESKIREPVLRAGLVSRTALINRLRATSSFQVVAVTAPAGYGKTTMLAQWAVRDPRPFAWISMDERDGDPIVLLRHLGAALHAIEPLQPEVTEALATPGPSIWARALPRLGSAVSSSKSLVIVLDDAHLLPSGDSLEAVDVLSDHIPEGSLLVLAGRVAPKLPIPALRAAGRLLEMGVEQLALTPREGQALLRSAGADPTFEEVTKLVRECEGWPAALYLAALALREDETGAPTATKPMEAADPHARIAEYFRHEYLARLRPGALQFLRRTSVLEQMCGGLCDAVLGREGSARELERIERANLFLVPLDRRRVWYRYHRLFRDVLRRELAEREPKLVRVLHRRAADWYEARGDRESELEHARAAGDFRRTARIITTIAQPMYHAGRAASVEGWLATFDDPTLLERFPTVALQGSWIHALRGRPAEAERWLQLAETGLRSSKRPRGTAEQQSWIALIRAALCSEGVEQMIADAEAALAGIPRNDQIRPSALMVLGIGYVLLGQAERADQILAEAASEAERLGATDTRVLAISERSIISAAQNDAATAESLAFEARDLVVQAGLEGYGTAAIALAASARASLRHGRWDEARADLDKGRRFRSSLRTGLPWFSVQTRIELARSYLALRETHTAQALLAEIRELLRERPQVGVLADETEALAREVEAIPEFGGAAGLTPAELRLLPFLTTHLSFREIGEHLYVSRNTIKTQAISVYRKLGVTSRSDAIECATRLGLVETQPPAQ